MVWYYVSELRPPTETLFCSSLRWYTNMEDHSELILAWKTEELAEKSILVSLCPPQIPRRLTQARTRAFAEAGE
jgi:hypothetical protein